MGIVLLLAAGVAASWLLSWNGAPLILAVVWSVYLARGRRKRRGETAVAAAQEQLLAESRAADDTKRRELLARLAGDLHDVAAREPSA